ncbi:bifunctional YncE family protein/alkaline phosphatase family protein [Stakelama marina]|uniref:Bifunctional YncE family protein/alkaline phosphatase family protein n=1 Tax=Stakelama marina TaxID=2826939 RepID=A0A8T4IC46_9SPHN|nr:bifunctional YncE family protein/alkaline phosphatase family protein [Stakelama marina]MBR0551672.1 bifunctional YncE family protein/alkaline phosphatase family protein [Stakelama marina]
MIALAALALATASQAAPPQDAAHTAMLSTSKRITPTAAPGAHFQPLNPGLERFPNYTADHAVNTALSPDGKTLLVLTSGYNRIYRPPVKTYDKDKGQFVFIYPTGETIADASNEYVFVYALDRGDRPVLAQVIQVPDTFSGIAWNPDQTNHPEFYVAGGVDDNVHVYRQDGDEWREDGTPIALGHSAGLGIGDKPMAAGLAVSPDGARMLVANLANDSVSLIDVATRKVLAEQDLRPGKIDPARHGIPGGEYPFDITFAGPDRAYVSSLRDREVDILGIDPADVRVTARIHLKGQPNHLLLNRSGTRLFVTSDNSDTLDIIDTARNRIVESVPTVAPPNVFPDSTGLKGANPNNLALSPDGRTMFVTNGGTNAVAVVALGSDAIGNASDARQDDDEDAGIATASHVIGLIPTGWYPDAVAVAPGSNRLIVFNAKSPPGPNPGHCNTESYKQVVGPCDTKNQYVMQLEKAGMLDMPMPDGAALAKLTRQVAANNGFDRADEDARDADMMAFLRKHIHHVIYIVRENRTYDQVLGDLDKGNGDPSLAILAPFAPNAHRWADQFVDFDNFYDSGEASNTGWDWTTAARTNDYLEKNAPVNYAGRGLTYPSEGTNRNINVGYGDLAQRRRANPDTPDDPDLLPGARDVAELDGPGEGEAGQGYLWNSALRAGLSMRNYGFFGDLARYSRDDPAFVPMPHDPFAAHVRQYFPTKAALRTHSDPYYRGFDNKYADYWRYREWKREFDLFTAQNDLPTLSLVRLMHDHFGNFADAADGVNTVSTQMADNDYAVARVIDDVAHSRYKDDTLIFVIEDDAQAGADHVDAHRSVGFIVGPYVKHHAVVSTHYTTVNMLRTIEDVLGIAPLGLNDGLARPMTDAFDTSRADWTYDAVVPAVLRGTELPLPAGKITASADACGTHSPRDAAYWAAAMKGQDFSQEDRLDTPRFNAALWRGLTGQRFHPQTRGGADLRTDRTRLLAHTRAPGAGLCGHSR